ncbi:MAG: hypothetical protein CMP67_04055 [Flavobacteriales bacterium]|nr:hypothetical protein [Flavobacteriales bacterium]MBO72719.1 hypothetical protein [Flavobacteriales bacterium]|tara:strand:+ start:664 stop:1257 length:594 start_codon:yes stop_codon:yes gene_type:complete
MKRLLIIVFIAFTQLTYGKNTVYVLVWGSTQTQSGAGHTSIAFSDSNGIHYYSSYSRGDGGIIDTFLCEVNEVFGLDSAIGLQASSPSLILSFEVNEHEYQEMRLTARKKATKRWSLFFLNCADFVKYAFKKTNYDVGYAFLISTPYEFIHDLKDHNRIAFEEEKILSVKGAVSVYLRNEPRAIPFVFQKFVGLKKR